MSSRSIETIAKRAYDLRCDTIRMIAAAGSGHPGGSLSAADIIATLFFGDLMTYDPTRPQWSRRDRFILSKGHAAPIYYAALAEAGFYPKDEMMTLRKFGSRLQGHPDSKKLPGVEVCTGSLGQGLSIASGLAWGLRQQAKTAHEDPQNVFVLMGDGEQQEGQVWEAAMFAAHNHLENLIAIIDNNRLQIDGCCARVMSFDSLGAKYESFGWHVIEVDGHDIELIGDALEIAKSYAEGPSVVIAHTVKGRGVTFMENQAGWHGKAPSEEECACALDDLAVGYERILHDLSLLKGAQ